MRRFCVLVFAILAGVGLRAQGVSLENQLKAGYLFNFLKFIEWPAAVHSGPLTICVAGRNPFGDVLVETLRGERVHESTLVARVIVMPEAGCHVVFVPRGVAMIPTFAPPGTRPR